MKLFQNSFMFGTLPSLVVPSRLVLAGKRTSYTAHSKESGLLIHIVTNLSRV
ncbi:MAG: hypothetical protein ACOYLR_03485 [Chlorobium sp.]